MQMKFVKGDATSPETSGNKIIAHICNDVGGWGKGFVMALSAKWKEPEILYRQWHKSGDNFALGQTQFVKVEELLWVANIIGQRDVRKDKNGNPPVRYEAISEGLGRVAQFARTNYATVHMPRIGCGLAGGNWEEIEKIVIEQLISKGIEVTVYDF